MKTNMKRLMRAAAAAVVLPALCAEPLDAQVTKVGTTAATFLSIPVGARALGMGGAFVGLANDASAMYWNPGGIARLEQNEAIFVHANWIAGISFNYGGVVIPVQDVGTFGVSFTSLSMGDMERTTEELPDGTGTTFSAGSFAVGLAYARNLTDWFSIGGNVKFIDEHIWNESATGFALDVGTLLSTPFPGLKFGAGISNFGTKMHMSGDDLLVLKPISTNAGASQSINAILSTDQFDLPLTLRIGFAYQPLVTEDQVLTLVVDAVHPNDNSESMSVGVEYTTLMKILSVRAGYNGVGMQDGESQFTLGGGLQYEVWPGAIVRIDYAFERFGRLNDIHKFGVGLLF